MLLTKGRTDYQAFISESQMLRYGKVTLFWKKQLKFRKFVHFILSWRSLCCHMLCILYHLGSILWLVAVATKTELRQNYIFPVNIYIYTSIVMYALYLHLKKKEKQLWLDIKFAEKGCAYFILWTIRSFADQPVTRDDFLIQSTQAIAWDSS